jgi:iron-sulfur cluster insertion protein
MAEIQVAYPDQLTNNEVNLTDAALAKMGELISDADDELTAIRVYVSGGGCGGMQYGLTFAEGATETDSIMEAEGFKLVVDPVALNYLQGCTIDFATQGANASFVFKDVFQAVGGSGACGACGSSGGGCG